MNYTMISTTNVDWSKATTVSTAASLSSKPSGTSENASGGLEKQREANNG